tara:strand:+ start:489 stop:1952 length:1464 start_codon:yes stop_codon:yes gene_type:complete
MQEEGDTVTQEIETEHLGEGHIDTVTQTTVTVEHKTTEDILDKDTGIVTNRYEGDMDLDWGGLGPASMPNCDAYFGTGKCGKGTSNSLTTFDQYVDISDFHIEDGGALEWELQMYHSQSNTTGYFQTKGYNDNVLQWDTGQINLENTGSPETFSGSHDFAGDLDKVFIRIGGKKNYYFDNVEYTINYNYITTTVETWIEIVQPTQMEEQLTLDLIDTYESATPVEQQEMDTMMEEMDMVIQFELEPVEIDSVQLDEMPETMPTDMMEETFQNMDIDNMSFDEIMVEVETLVAELEDTGMKIETVEIKMPDVEKSPTEMSTEATIEEVGVSTQPETTEVSESSSKAQESANEEKTEKSTSVSENKVETKEIKEEVKEQSEPEPIAEQQKEVVENKPTKEQEQKQKKAKEIMAALPSNYDPVAQLTTLALVNALGPDIRTYQQQDIITQTNWYAIEEIYTNNNLPDPLSDYISVRSSLQMEKMISQQYE